MSLHKNYWINDFTECQNIIYRTYVENYQSHVWEFLYRTKEYNQCSSCSREIINTLLINNYESFTDYIQAPSNEKITIHINQIKSNLNDMQEHMNQIKSEYGNGFSGGFFLNNIDRMINEFSIDI